MKKILLFTLCTILVLPAFGQMAGGASKRYKGFDNSTQEYARGYKGFVEVGYTYGSYRSDYEWNDQDTYKTVAVQTTHGYQFNSYFFAGAGIGLGADFDDIIVPLFAEARCNILNPNRYKYTPFIGTRIGYEIINSSFLANPFIGYRFPVYKQMAINLSIGYQYLEYCSNNAFTIHLGVDF